MGIKRRDILDILEAETEQDAKVKALLDIYHRENDALHDQIDELQTELQNAKAEAKTAQDAKTEAEQALADHKAETEAEKTRSVKAELYREALTAAGIKGEYIDKVMKHSKPEIDALVVEDGKLKDGEGVTNAIKNDWGEYIATTRTEGAPNDNPPKAMGQKMTREQIFAIKDTSARQKAIAENIEIFQGVE